MRLIIFHYISIFISLSTPVPENTEKFGNCSKTPPAPKGKIPPILRILLDNIVII